MEIPLYRCPDVLLIALLQLSPNSTQVSLVVAYQILAYNGSRLQHHTPAGRCLALKFSPCIHLHTLCRTVIIDFGYVDWSLILILSCFRL